MTYDVKFAYFNFLKDVWESNTGSTARERNKARDRRMSTQDIPCSEIWELGYP